MKIHKFQYGITTRYHHECDEMISATIGSESVLNKYDSVRQCFQFENLDDCELVLQYRVNDETINETISMEKL